MKPRDDFCNGDEGSGSDSEAGSEGDTEVWVEDAAAPARALAALNALRKSRQHYDVVLVAAGAAGGEAGEVPAHRALLAAASPYLLQALAAPASPAPEAPAGPTAIRVDGVEADALRELVEYMYTGRLSARDAAAARRLYLCAWRLRLEAARVALAERLARRPLPADCLDTRALPDLPPHCLHQLDAYIADNFDLLCGGGALATLPLVRIEMLRASSACGGGEAAQQVADAALAWLRDRQPSQQLEELWARGHLVFVDAGGALRDCGELPAARGDAPEIREYRRAAELRAERPRRVAGVSRPLAGVTLGARDPRPDTAVLAARASGGGGVTRALLLLRGQLLAARISWREMDTGVSPGGPLGQAGEQRATLTEGRCALGSAVLGARLIVCGGYDRARVLRAAEAYSADSNEWRPLPDMRTARARFPAARLGGSLYVVGGSDGHDELDSVDVYREDKGWSSVARLPLAASHAGAAGDEVKGRLHVVGGWAAGRSLRAVHTYDPGTDGWSDAPPLATGRSQCAAVVWGRALWALGGCDSWHCLATTEYLQLDEPHATWTPGAALPTARRSVGGCVWRGALVSAGGSDGAASLRRVDCLTSPTDTAWKPLPSLRRARAALGLHELRDVLYAVGGFDGKEFLSCVECLYSPDDEWTTLCAPPPRAPISVATVPQGIDLPQGVDVPRETDLPRDNDGANSPDTERAEKAVKDEPPKKEPERLENGAATAAECE